MRNRLTWGRVLLAALAVGSGPACAGQGEKYNPFVVPRAQITGSVRTIALTPISAPEDLGSVHIERGKFDSLLTAELRTAGYAVVPWEEAGEIWLRIRDSLGGFFDPATGRPDSTKFSQARSLTMRELQDRFQADALLHPRIVYARAEFNSGNAEWDGTSQSYQSGGKKFLAALLGNQTYGQTPALSVQVTMEDMGGHDLYINQGGLQLFEVPSGNGFARIPPQEIFRDRERNAQAVHLALAPLLGSKPEDAAGH